MGSAWAKFLREVDRERTSLGFQTRETCFFRGHEEMSWDLLPTLLRHCRDQGVPDAAGIRDLEASLYFEFRARARELHEQASSEWDILFGMRHHGVATRLLDWTETLGVAVYFALRRATPASRPCVWLLNPWAMNELSWEERDLVAPEYLPQGDYGFSDYLVSCGTGGGCEAGAAAGFDWTEPVALYPIQRNARLHAQRGFFTIHGDDVRPLNEIFPDLVRQVPLPSEAWEDARSFLADAGIDEFLMFPDLDGLARYLHEKHEIL